MRSLYERIILLCVGLVVSACAASRSTQVAFDHRVVSSELPIGTDKQKAIDFMEATGFTCKEVLNGEFTAKPVDSSGKQHVKTHTNIHFLECHRKDGGVLQDGFVTTYRSFGIVLDKDEKVLDVLTRVEFVGL